MSTAFPRPCCRPSLCAVSDRLLGGLRCFNVQTFKTRPPFQEPRCAGHPPLNPLWRSIMQAQADIVSTMTDPKSHTKSTTMAAAATETMNDSEDIPSRASTHVAQSPEPAPLSYPEGGLVAWMNVAGAYVFYPTCQPRHHN